MRLLSSTCLIVCLLCVSASRSQAQDKGSAADDYVAPTRSVVMHIPPSVAKKNRDLRLVAVVDAPWVETSLVVRYRTSGSNTEFLESPFERSSAGGYFATIPAQAMRRPGVEYYVVGQLADGSEILHFASASRPHTVAVAPSRNVRWAEKERQRLGGYTSEVSFDVNGHNFGNRYGNNDRFIRGELAWTHRLLGRSLYSITLGYGMVEGQTPDGRTDQAMTMATGARYGYAGVRLRLKKSIWLDGEASMGVDRDGFIVGTGAALTFGRPWRSNLQVGAEVMQGMGPSLWFKLQWDTVPPFLMSATVYKTDVPGAVLADGSFVIFDVVYPISPRVQVRGSVSFGSRDGPGNFGGGLGTSFAF